MNLKLNLIPALVLCLAPALFAASEPKSIRGTVESINVAGQIVEVKTPDGILYSVTVTEVAEIDGAKSHGLVVRGIAKGSTIIAHGTVEGTKFTAHQVYRVGKGAVKVGTVTVKTIGDGGEFLVVTTAKGAEKTYHITSDALKTAAKGTAKGTKVVIYSSAKAGKEVAHFFEAAI
jgi:hypothetical protein